jgi:atypical dual specificity phosphatase
MGNKKKTEDLPDDVGVVLESFLYLGSVRTTELPLFFAKHGITHVLSIGYPPAATFPDVVYEQLPLEDDPSAQLSKICGRAFEFIDAAASSRSRSNTSSTGVSQGTRFSALPSISRSPSIVAAYLMCGRGMTLKESLRRVLWATGVASPNKGFLSQLKEMEAGLLGRVSVDWEEMPMDASRQLGLFNKSRS